MRLFTVFLTIALLCAQTPKPGVIVGAGGGGGGGGGGVSSLSGACGLDTGGAPITSTGTVTRRPFVNTNSNPTDTIASVDCGRVNLYTNSGSVTIAVPALPNAAFFDGWFIDILNGTSGGIITFTGGITGSIGAGTSARLVSDGTQWRLLRGAGVQALTGACGISVIGPPLAVQTQNLILTNIQTGASYTVLNSDCGKLISMQNAGASTLVIPAPSAVNIFYFEVVNTGAGTVTFSGFSGTLAPGQSAKFVSDSTNWIMLRGAASGGASTPIATAFFPFGRMVVSSYISAISGVNDKPGAYRFMVPSPGISFSLVQMYTNGFSGIAVAGIYDSACALLHTWPRTGAGTTGSIRFIPGATVTLQPGDYYFAVSSSLNTDTIVSVAPGSENSLGIANVGNPSFPAGFILTNNTFSSALPATCGTKLAPPTSSFPWVMFANQ